MPGIVAFLQVIAPLISRTTLRQMSHVLYGLLVTTRRITMLEISRWTEAGGVIGRFNAGIIQLCRGCRSDGFSSSSDCGPPGMTTAHTDGAPPTRTG